MRKRYLRLTQAVVALVLFVLAFGYGVGVGRYHWPPFYALRTAKRLARPMLSSMFASSQPEQRDPESLALRVDPTGDSRWVKQGVVIQGRTHPSIAYDEANDRFVMVYIEPVLGSIKYATAPSSAPHDWTEQGMALEPVRKRAWDENRSRGLSLVRSDGKWYLYYDDKRNGKIGVAVGEDIASLARHEANPILEGDGIPGSYEQYVRHPAVVPPAQSPDGKWHMIYDGRQHSAASMVGDLRHATSVDGVKWEKDTAHNPALSPSHNGDWESDDLGSPSVLRVGDRYYMAYHGYNEFYGAQFDHYPHWIGIATSTDLVHWKKAPDNPKVVMGAESEFDSMSVYGPTWLKAGDGAVYLYYVGSNREGMGIGRVKTDIGSGE